MSTPTRIGFDEATAILDRVAASRRMPVERQPLSRCLGLVLAEDVVAAAPLPGFDNAAMDGFALRAVDATQAGADLELVGEQFAGLDQARSIGPGQCLRITTGAPLPAGADSVVMKEDTRLVDGRIQ